MILNSVELFGFQALNCWKFPGFPRVICTFRFGFQNCWNIHTPLGNERNKHGLFYNFLSLCYNFIGIFQ